MKAVLVTRFGPAAEVADVAEVPEPGPPGPGQVLLDILAAPINPSDFLVFQGRFGPTPPPLPAPAGGEAVGQVATLGEGVTNLKIGDWILALHAGRENWRQRVLAPAAGVCRHRSIWGEPGTIRLGHLLLPNPLPPAFHIALES